MLRTLAAAVLSVASLAPAQTTLAPQDRQLAHDLLKQLIEINTTDSVGNVTTAASAMRDRLLAAGYPASDLQLLGPNARKQNLLARIPGRPGSALKPVLLIGHLDVVEARREDWTTDPFVLTEKDGFFYGRGTQDMKNSDAAVIAALIRFRKEGFVPDRDLLIALTADEEGGQSNGVDWLLQHRPELHDVAFVLNPDAGGLTTISGKPLVLTVEATEKLYADFHITATNPGGHSSLPRADNAIYSLAAALIKLQQNPFPLELNDVTRAELAAYATLVPPAEGADMRAVLQPNPNPAAVAHLSTNPEYNAILRTTCVATMLSGGHAPNALPGRAQANVNCRILPGHSAEETRQTLIHLFNNPQLTVEYVTDAGMVLPEGPTRKSAPPPPLNPQVFNPLRATVQKIWPGLTILPEMEAGASDSIYTMALGLPSYGFNGMGIDRDDVRAHGRDERISIESYYTGVEFEYQYLRALTTP